MNKKNKLTFSAFVLGLNSIIAQIIIIRELVVVFYGNELSLGVILASWLFWVSIGSGILGRLVDRLYSKEKLLSYIQIAGSLILPLNILFIRNIKSILNISAGEIIGFIPMFSSSFLSLSLICIMLGFTFTLVSKLQAENSPSPSSEVGRIYLYEGLGASIGGLVYSFFLIKILTPFQNAFVIGAINLITSLLFNINLLQLIILCLVSIAFILNLPMRLEKHTRSLQFRPFRLVESIDSIYGNISIIRSGEEYSFYENGLLMFTSGDKLTSEESVHYAMLSHPYPEKVLLIGGGMSGSLSEILKHPVKGVDYVELDPLIIDLATKYLPPINDKRVNIVHMDGRLFVKRLSLQHKKYDVIITNLPDPYTAMLNRFYSWEFFLEVKNALSSNGIFSFLLSSSENYINPEQAYYLASIYNTLKTEFSDIKIFPGDTAIFLASNKKGLLTYDANILTKRLLERNIDTKYVREYYLPFKLSPMRIQYIENSISQSKNAKINKDFKPIGYLYHASLWMTLFYSGKGVLPFLERLNLNLFILIIISLCVILFFIQKLLKASFKMPVIVSIGTTGMSELAFQIIVILTFQFLYGYLYYKIGLILTSFMIGLVLGSLCINKIIEKIQDEKSLYLKTQFFICVYPLILPVIFSLIQKANITSPRLSEALQLSFVFLPIIAGFIGGFQFPLAAKICLKGSETIGKTVGLLYGIDLLGSCIGALIVGLLLVPVLGILETCILLFILNASVLISLASSKQVI